MRGHVRRRGSSWTPVFDGPAKLIPVEAIALAILLLTADSEKE
jgi:hypothetical protein